MGRLCERPGCSEVAAVAYGMRIEDLVFWLDALTDSNAEAGGVLCQRHGDSMIVPRGWTLDDLRDPDLHLFRPPPRPDRPSRAPRRRRDTDGDSSEAVRQLELGEIAASPTEPNITGPNITGPNITGPNIPASGSDQPSSAAPVAAEAVRPDVAERSGDQVDAVDAPEPVAEGAAPDRWTPSFDDADDLDGLLAARSPLLSRAFRGADRPD